ncbi:MAG: protein kinase [Myxococcaceae bacterium]
MAELAEEPLPMSKSSLEPAPPVSKTATPAPSPESAPLTGAGTGPAVIAPPGSIANADEDPMLGQTIGSFKVVKVIGRGGMGTVYLGEQTVIGSKVAIKILHDHLATNPGLVQRFYAEAKAVNLIGHENIVNIFDMNVVPPRRYYLIMELLEGKPLNLAFKGAMDPHAAVPILTQVCDALDAAHDHGVVHRDLKPENIYLVRRGRKDSFVKILDFGIAKLFATDSTEQTAAGMIVGTPEYMAPEQCSSQPVDGRTDIYSLGVISYLLLTGKLPFSGGGVAGLLIAHQSQVPTPANLVNPSLPQPLADAVMKALQKKPADRYQHASDFATALTDALALMPAPGTPAPRPSTPPPSQPVIAVPPPPPSAPIASPAVPDPGSHPPTPSPVANAAAVAQLVPPSATAGMPEKASTPQPVHARHVASFDAKVTSLDGKLIGLLKCQDISKGGCFLCTDGALPQIFSRVRVSFPVAGDLECLGEVVRHVTPPQAIAWNMSPGFGVQFTNLSNEQKEALNRVTQGLPAAKPAAPVHNDRDDAEAELTLYQYRKRINGDHYVVLALLQDAEMSEVRARGRESKRELDGLKLRKLSDQQRLQVDTATNKVNQALEVIGNAGKRVEYDANRANFRGVARCIAAGLTVTELEKARAVYLKGHPGAESQAHVKFVTGNAYEQNNQMLRAVESYEEALKLDPLNLRYQQRYWGLKRKAP